MLKDDICKNVAPKYGGHLKMVVTVLSFYFFFNDEITPMIIFSNSWFPMFFFCTNTCGVRPKSRIEWNLNSDYFMNIIYKPDLIIKPLLKLFYAFAKLWFYVIYCVSHETWQLINSYEGCLPYIKGFLHVISLKKPFP